MDQATQTFEASIERESGGMVLAFQGELDISSVQRAEAELQRAEGEMDKGAPIVLDLRALEFMDSTGLRFILGAHQRAKEAGRRFAVVQGPDAVDRVFRVTRVDSLVDIVASPAEALAG